MDKGIDEMNIEKNYSKAVLYKEKKKYDEAKSILHDILNSPEKEEFREIHKVYNEVGLICILQNDAAQAIPYLEKASLKNPEWEEPYNNLGTVYTMLQQYEKAEQFYVQAISKKNDYVAGYRNLATLYKVKEEYGRAIEWFDKLLNVQPDNDYALTSLGKIYSALEEFSKAEEILVKALELFSENAEALLLLGSVYSQQGKHIQALSYYVKASEINPTSQNILNNLAGSYSNLRLKNEARMTYEKLLNSSELEPGIFSNYLFYLNSDPTFAAEEVFLEHKKYVSMYANQNRLNNLIKHERNATHRKIRVGYISPDFRTHSVSYFMAAPILFYDKNQFEVYCYSDALKKDSVTEQFQKNVDYWRETRKLNHSELAEVIIRDEIDILVDLAGHTANNRMGLFLNRIAPIQVAWIGYPNTTGLDTMDYRIADTFTDPVGLTDRYYTEKLVRMPESFLCYTPGDVLPSVSELPCLSKGYIAFGCFNNFGKITNDLLVSWGEILKRVPNSKLLLKSSISSDEMAPEFFAEQFRKCGIDPQRVILEKYRESINAHLELYNEVDIALDCYFYNGTTTTCESLSMGVPVVTLEGDRHASRVGVSLLSNVGLTEFIAKTPEEYVGIAVEMAGRLEYLSEVRKSLRTKMKSSILMQPKRFMRQLEELFKSMISEMDIMSSEMMNNDQRYNEEIVFALMKIIALLEKEGRKIEKQLETSTVEEAIALCCQFAENIPQVQEVVTKHFATEANLNKLFLVQMKKGIALLLESCEEKDVLRIKDVFSNIVLEILKAAYPILKDYYLKALNKEDTVVESNIVEIPTFPPEIAQLAEEMKKFPYWYHKIELPGGLVTPGWAPLNRDKYQIPKDMTGMRVLDVGSWDGFWAFEALKRGAKEVVAIDDFSDFLGNLEESDRKAWETFDFCKKALGYSDEQCKRMEISVYDITEEILGRFDIVFCFGVLYHLRHPLLALDKLSALCDREIYVETAILDDYSPYQGGIGHGYQGAQYVAEFYSENQYGNNHTNWWVPTLHCLAQLVLAAGFQTVDVWKLTDNPQHLSQCRGFAQGRKEEKNED